MLSLYSLSIDASLKRTNAIIRGWFLQVFQAVKAALSWHQIFLQASWLLGRVRRTTGKRHPENEIYQQAQAIIASTWKGQRNMDWLMMLKVQVNNLEKGKRHLTIAIISILLRRDLPSLYSRQSQQRLELSHLGRARPFRQTDKFASDEDERRLALSGLSSCVYYKGKFKEPHPEREAQISRKTSWLWFLRENLFHQAISASMLIYKGVLISFIWAIVK